VGIGFVPKNRLGEIRDLPGIGRRFVTLWKFHREGLAQLESQPPFESHMLTNRRLLEAGKKLQNWIPRSPHCDACGRTFLEINGNVPLASPSTQHDLVMVTPKGRREAARHFCWGCASSRDTLIEVCGDSFAQSIAEDGVDVFAYIAQTIYEDQLADKLGIQSLQCHNGRYAPKYARMIGGRLQELIDDGEYVGPLHPGPDVVATSPDNDEQLAEADRAQNGVVAVEPGTGSMSDIAASGTPTLDGADDQLQQTGSRTSPQTTEPAQDTDEELFDYLFHRIYGR
jgi:hypothetical protein